MIGESDSSRELMMGRRSWMPFRGAFSLPSKRMRSRQVIDKAEVVLAYCPKLDLGEVVTGSATICVLNSGATSQLRSKCLPGTFYLAKMKSVVHGA